MKVNIIKNPPGSYWKITYINDNMNLNSSFNHKLVVSLNVPI